MRTEKDKLDGRHAALDVHEFTTIMCNLVRMDRLLQLSVSPPLSLSLSVPPPLSLSLSLSRTRDPKKW